jgi:hypothetical protein
VVLGATSFLPCPWTPRPLSRVTFAWRVILMPVAISFFLDPQSPRVC